MTDEWIKLWYIHNGVLVIKRNTSESVLMRWMNQEPIIQSKISQKKKDKYHTYYIYTWNLGLPW